MSRQARVKAEFLHVIVRGIGRQILFEDNEDRYYFLSLLQNFKDDLNIIILAYCIMDNHYHLLVRNPDYTISTFMLKIGVCYAGYYNKKYQRVGHLFQNRFKSEVITDNRSLVSVYRYILKNPEKAGIAPAGQYPWSSFSDYNHPNRLTETSLLVPLIGSPENFKLFMAEDDDMDWMEVSERINKDAWALEIIKETLRAPSGTVLQTMGKKERDENLALLKSKGISIRQLERLTGINRGIIQKAGKVRRKSCQIDTSL